MIGLMYEGTDVNETNGQCDKKNVIRYITDDLELFSDDSDEE